MNEDEIDTNDEELEQLVDAEDRAGEAVVARLRKKKPEA